VTISRQAIRKIHSHSCDATYIIFFLEKICASKLQLLIYFVPAYYCEKTSGKYLRKGSEAKRWEATDRLKDIGVYIYGEGREKLEEGKRTMKVLNTLPLGRWAISRVAPQHLPPCI
jgi:hypothetical protein